MTPSIYNILQKTDISALESIDISLQEVFLYNDAFKEAKDSGFLLENGYELIELLFQE